MTRVSFGLASGTWYVEADGSGKHDAYSSRDEDYDSPHDTCPAWLAEVLTLDGWCAPFTRAPNEPHL